PTDLPPDAGAIRQIIDMVGSDRFLLFSTDYPHWQFDGDEALPAGLSASLVHKLLVDNPLETYPRLKESVA
ncbi:MAG TPA: amidohydrolase family protein, partial [Acetobacteraceae bacterium]|nr:amidohydrolase family protein [Acetobacteraceae bacterium]